MGDDGNGLLKEVMNGALMNCAVRVLDMDVIRHCYDTGPECWQLFRFRGPRIQRRTWTNFWFEGPRRTNTPG